MGLMECEDMSAVKWERNSIMLMRYKMGEDVSLIAKDNGLPRYKAERIIQNQDRRSRSKQLWDSWARGLDPDPMEENLVDYL